MRRHRNEVALHIDPAVCPGARGVINTRQADSDGRSPQRRNVHRHVLAARPTFLTLAYLTTRPALPVKYGAWAIPQRSSIISPTTMTLCIVQTLADFIFIPVSWRFAKNLRAIIA